MKWGLIWARRARSSASMTRVRVRASSARASWLETQAATSSVARARPGEGSWVQAVRVPTTRSSMTRGAVTALRTGQSGSAHATSRHPCTTVRPVSRVCSPRARAVPRWWSPTPVHDNTLPGVGDRHGVRTEDGEQVPAGALRGIRGEALAEVLRGERCRVQRRVGGPVDLGEEAAPAAAPSSHAANPIRSIVPATSTAVGQWMLAVMGSP